MLLLTLAPRSVAGDAMLEALFYSPFERSGDADGLAGDWLGRLSERPQSPYSELALIRLGSVESHVLAPNRLVELLEELLSNGDLGGVERQLVKESLDRLYRRLGREEDWRRLDVDGSHLVHWAVVGPLGLGVASQLERVFPPEEKIDLEATYASLRRRVRWRHAGPVPPVRTVHASDFLRPGRGVYYHLCQLRSATRRAVVLHVGTSRPVWVYVNGRRLRRETDDTFRTNPRRLAVELGEGWNHILVKNRGEAFSVRVTDLVGRPIGGDEISQETTLELREPTADGDSGPGPELPDALRATLEWRAYVERRLDGEEPPASERALHRLAAALYARSYNRPDLSVWHVEQALEDDPENPFVQFHAGGFLRAGSHLPSDTARRRARLAFEKALALDEDLVPARLEVGSFLLADDQPRRAAEQAQQALQRNERCLPVLLFLHATFEERDWEAEAVNSARRIEEVAPHERTPHLYRAHRAEALSNSGAAIEHYRAALERDRRASDLLERIAELELRRGRPAEAQSALEEFLRRRPGHPQSELAYARFLETTGRFDEASTRLKTLLETFPENARILRRLATVEETAGKKADALTTYRRLLDLAPGDLRLREYVRALEGKDRDRFWAPFDEELEEWIPKIPDSSRYPKAESIAVLDLAVVKVHPDGSTAEYTHQAFKLISEAAKENLARVETDGETLKLRTVTADGRVLEPTAAEGRHSFVMPGLERDAIVEFAYLAERPKFAGWKLENGPFYFQDFTFRQPFLLSRYVLLLPPGLDAHVLQRAFADPADKRFSNVTKTERQLADGSRAVVYETVEAPRMRPEFRMPAREDYIPHVLLTEKRSWLEVAERLRDGLRGRTRLTPRLRRFAAEATAGIDSPAARARALFERVNDLVKTDNGPRDANGILLDKGGDRAVLFKALLDAAGVPSHWAFARLRDDMAPRADFNYPDTDLFNDRLVVVEPPDGTRTWVSLRQRLAPYGKLPFYLEGGTALVLKQGGPALSPVPTSPPDGKAEVVEATIELGAVEADELAARVSLAITSPSYSSYGAKTQLKDIDAHRRDLYLRQIAVALFPAARLKKAELPRVAEAGVPLTIRLDLEAPRHLSVSERDAAAPGGEYLLRSVVQPLDLVRNFVRGSERQHPYRYASSTVRRDRIRIDLGDFRVARLPETTLLLGDLGSYSLRLSQEGDSLTVERQLDLHPATLPAERFGDLLEFCRAVDAAEARRIVLQK